MGVFGLGEGVEPITGFKYGMIVTTTTIVTTILLMMKTAALF